MLIFKITIRENSRCCWKRCTDKEHRGKRQLQQQTQPTIKGSGSSGHFHGKAELVNFADTNDFSVKSSLTNWPSLCDLATSSSLQRLSKTHSELNINILRNGSLYHAGDLSSAAADRHSQHLHLLLSSPCWGVLHGSVWKKKTWAPKVSRYFWVVHRTAWTSCVPTSLWTWEETTSDSPPRLQTMNWRSESH